VDLFEKCRRFDRADELRQAGLYPYFQEITENRTEEVVVDGRPMVMVGSNNYLGLTHHPHVKAAAIDAVERYGSGCTGSRFLNGTLDLHVELERRLARFMKTESALTFSTGFQVNLGVISVLAGKGDVIFCDRENHASIFDGCRLSFAQLRKYRHNDTEDLERQLAQCPDSAGRLIITDGVFSMKGDLCELPEIVRLAKKYDARILLDDAHGIGVLGEHGRGTAEHFGLEDEVDMVVGTFSKSFASLGGFATGKSEVIDFVKHHARALIFSASPAPASAAATLAALDVIENEPERRQRLWDNVGRMSRAFQELGYDVSMSRSPIIPITVGGDVETFAFWRRMHDAGIFTNPVISPAVPPGEGLLRTSYMATHREEELDRVVEAFARLGRAAGLVPAA
jgi:8-amino-7-oxononanoate synthase